MADEEVTPGPYKGKGVFCNIAGDVMDQAAAAVEGGIIQITMFNAVVGGGTGTGAVDANGHFSMDQPDGLGAPLTIEGSVNADCTEIVAQVKNGGEVIETLKGKATPGYTKMSQCGGNFSQS